MPATSDLLAAYVGTRPVTGMFVGQSSVFAGGGPEILLVGSTKQSGAAITGMQCTLPGGSAVGDFCVVVHGTNYGLSPIEFPGGTVALTVGGGAFQDTLILYTKVLDASDISNGYVAVNLPNARGAIVTAVFTGGVGSETPDDTTEAVFPAKPHVQPMPTPASSNTLTIWASHDDYSNGNQYATPSEGLTFLDKYWYGTANDASVSVYWTYNQTGLPIPDQTVTWDFGNVMLGAAEFSFV